jgi:hypothetical protein
MTAQDQNKKLLAKKVMAIDIERYRSELSPESD